MNRNKYFMSEQDKFHEHSDSNNLTISFLDDNADVFCNDVNETISSVKCNKESISHCYYMITKFIKNQPEETQKKRLKNMLKDAVIIDGTYQENGVTAIDIRNEILRIDPSYRDRILFLVGEDIMEHIDKYSKEYKNLQNINYTVYKNKLETIQEFALAQASKKGISAKVFDPEPKVISADFMTALDKQMSNLKQYINELRTLKVANMSIKKYTPQSREEQFMLDILSKNLEDTSLAHHSSSQLYCGTSTHQKFMVADETKPTIYNPDQKPIIFSEKLSQYFKPTEQKYADTTILSSVDHSELARDLNDLYFISPVEYKNLSSLNLAAQHLGTSSKEKSNYLYIANPTNIDELTSTLEIKDKIRSKNPNLDHNFVIIADKELYESVPQIKKDQVVFYENFAQEVQNQISQFSKTNNYELETNLPNGKVRREIYDYAKNTSKQIAVVNNTTKTFFSDMAEFEKIVPQTVTEENVKNNLMNIKTGMAYYLHLSGQTCVGLTSSTHLAEMHNNIDETNTVLDSTTEELENQTQTEFAQKYQIEESSLDESSLDSDCENSDVSTM